MTYQTAAERMRRETSVVIPVYFPQGTEADAAYRLLSETAQAFAAELSEPGRLCLSVDGCPVGERAAERAAAETGATMVRSERNRGKFHSVRMGMLRLLEDACPQFLVIADQDGDHFANELLNFVRAAIHAQDAAREDRVLVLGRRISRHRPMGFLRGELEELADRVLLDALAWRAAQDGKPLRLEFTTTLDEFPDFHSGYKLFSRPVAEAIFRHEPDMAGLPAEAALRHAVEAVLCVEAMLAGALLVEVNRSTYDEQPLSTFGLLDRSRMVADKILWPCRRLGVPAPFVEQWVANHMPRLLLGTLTPQGADELARVRRLVREGYGTAQIAEPDDARILRTRFL